MTLRLHWFLPSHGDGRELVRAERTPEPAASARSRQRRPELDYLAQVALAADGFGFESVLTPFGLFCEDPWLLAAALAGRTRRLKFMVALRPGLISPTLAAQMAATGQRLSEGRMLLNVVAGSDADEQRRYGDLLDHDQRYERAEEFLTVVRGVWAGETVDLDGKHYQLRRAWLPRPPARPPLVFLGGSSPAAQQAAARHADVYLSWGETPDRIREATDQVRQLASHIGRTVSFGSRFHVISRDTAAQAWAEAQRLLSGVDRERIAAAQARFRRSESEGQRRVAALSQLPDLVVYPNMWAGFGLVRPGAGVGLVGSHQEVAERIEELHTLGLTHLILSGQPHLEEAYWFGEGVLPLLRQRGLLPELAASR